jgi:transmembrane sensor
MDPTDRLDRASDDAAHWWVRLQADDMSRDERETFVDWLRESQLHVAEMLRLAQVHGALDQFSKWASIPTDGPEEHAEVIPLKAQRPGTLTGSSAQGSRAQAGDTRRPRHRKVLWATAAAAVLVAIVITTTTLVPLWRGEVITTGRGERREVVLDDGSIVQVDPQTRLAVKFAKSERRILLMQGRAVFRVARQPQRPFLVEADDTTVRALGTAFGVERRERNVVIVTVAEGKVAVSSADASTTITPAHSAPVAAAPVYLIANQQVRVRRAQSATPVRAVDSERELAWAEGRLVFKDEPVANVIAEFNRYNRVQMQVTDAALAARPVSGVFDAANPEAFIAFIQSAAPVHIERDDGRSIVISR